MELRLGTRIFQSGSFAVMTEGLTDGADVAEVAADPEVVRAVRADEAEPAVAAVFAWAGARVFRTADVEATRQVLDMVASISGTRPPAVSRRGLA